MKLLLLVFLFNYIQVAHLNVNKDGKENLNTSLFDINILPKHDPNTNASVVITNTTHEKKNVAKYFNQKDVNQIPTVNQQLSRENFETIQKRHLKQLPHTVTVRETSLPCEAMVLTYGPIGFISELKLINGNVVQRQHTRRSLQSLPAQINATGEDGRLMMKVNEEHSSQYRSLHSSIRDPQSLEQNLDDRLKEQSNKQINNKDLYEEHSLRIILKQTGNISNSEAIQSSTLDDNKNKPCPKQPKFVDKIYVDKGVSTNCESDARLHGIDTKYAQEHFSAKKKSQDLINVQNEMGFSTHNEKGNMNKGHRKKEGMVGTLRDNVDATRNDVFQSKAKQEQKIVEKRYIAELHPMPETEDEKNTRQEATLDAYLQLAGNSHKNKDKPENELKDELFTYFHFWPKSSREWLYPKQQLQNSQFKQPKALHNGNKKNEPPFSSPQSFTHMESNSYKSHYNPHLTKYPSSHESWNFQLSKENDYQSSKVNSNLDENYYPVDYHHLLPISNYETRQNENIHIHTNNHGQISDNSLQNQNAYTFMEDTIDLHGLNAPEITTNDDYIELKPTEIFMSPIDKHNHMSVIWKKPQKSISSIHKVVQDKNCIKHKAMKIHSKSKVISHRCKDPEIKMISPRLYGHSKRKVYKHTS